MTQFELPEEYYQYMDKRPINSLPYMKSFLNRNRKDDVTMAISEKVTVKITGVDYVYEMEDGVEKQFVLIKTDSDLVLKIPAKEYNETFKKGQLKCD